MQTVYHLGVLLKGFSSGEFDENLIENLDKTHFVVNLDNGQTLGFWGDTIVKYIEVVPNDESMTTVLYISRGRSITIEVPMLIFSNENRIYPIRGLVNDILGVSYRIGPKGWMDQIIFPEYFLEPRTYQGNLHQCMKIIWLDNCSGHVMTPRLATIPIAKSTVFKLLPPCSIHLCQLADTFLISKIKDA